MKELIAVNEKTEMPSLDLLDIHRYTERTMERYQYLGQLMKQAYHAAEGDGNQAELKRLAEMASHKHAECGADLKAILRLVE